MDLKKVIDQTDNVLKTLAKASLAFAIIDIVLVIIIGVSSNKVDAIPWLITLLFFSLLYILIAIFKASFNKAYPASLGDELKAQYELRELNEREGRQSTISQFIVGTIEKLNNQTCALNPNEDGHMCDTDIQEGISDLIEPIIENTNFFLDTVETKFTIGLYLNFYRAIQEPHEQKGIIILSDTLKLFSDGLEKDLLGINNLSGNKLEVQMAIKKSFYNFEFEQKDFGGYTIISSPFPEACDETQATGTLFVIGKHFKKVPENLPTTLKIFNRVVANWLYRYNQCIWERLQRIYTQSLITNKPAIIDVRKEGKMN